MHIPTIDSHQHFWKFNPKRDSWITEDMQILQKDYLPVDIEAVYSKNKIKGSIVIQADSSEIENIFLLELADKHPFILGIVGWIDMTSENLEERLHYYKQFPILKGFRHLLQGEKQRDIMLNAGFQHGVSLLGKYGSSYDLLILPDQLGYSEKLVAMYPEQRFVIDHLAKPEIKNGIIAEWRKGIEKFTSYENVYCKISGMVTEADLEFWELEDFRPYLDTVLEVFGPKRIMFGSDWPVCLQAGTFEDVKGIIDDYFKSFTMNEQADFFGNNAIDFYKLN
jgi:L-fuconolactonase